MIKGDEEDNKGLSKGTFTFKSETKITTKNKSTGRKTKNPKLKRKALWKIKTINIENKG